MSASRHIVCPSCAAVNRLPVERAWQEARCGVCKAALFAGTPAEVSAAACDKHVSRDEIPVLVDFWAPWCGPCRSMAPQFARAAETLEPAVRLLKVNIDEAPQLAARYAVQSVPTLILFSNGKVAARSSGAMDSRSIVAFARSHG